MSPGAMHRNAGIARYVQRSTGLHAAWQRCLAGARILEELSITCSEVIGDVTRYANKMWLKTAIFRQKFPLLRQLSLNRAVVNASELGSFMFRYATALQEVVLKKTIDDNHFEGLANMLTIMSRGLKLQQCLISIHFRWHFDYNLDDMPADFRDILALNSCAQHRGER